MEKKRIYCLIGSSGSGKSTIARVLSKQEEPIKRNYDKTRRKKRGLFLSNIGTYINADINGAYQIINKVLPCRYKAGYKLHGYRCAI